MSISPLSLNPVLDYLDSSFELGLERLFALLRIESISADPNYVGECQRCAKVLEDDLKSIGFDTKLCETEGNPIVLARHRGVLSSAPHVLFYGHYDVQPVDPLDLWNHDPFKPQLQMSEKGTQVISGRGSSDDKGQLMTFLEACRAWKEVHGALPCHVTILLEGEEESGSRSLPSFLRERKEELKADVGLICDTSMHDSATPSVCISMRGLVTEEIILETSDRDLHSGEFGGIVLNPAFILAKILSDIHDSEGRVTIPGFYDGVEEVSSEIRESFRNLDKSEEKKLLPRLDLPLFLHKKNIPISERVSAFPSIDINGIQSGYTGKGFKTIIPAQAFAKISFRLVPNQNPEQIRKAFYTFVEERIPQGCSIKFLSHGSSSAVRFSSDSPFFHAARKALFEEWGKPALLTGCGASIPILQDFLGILGLQMFLAGFGLPDDRIHSPNEKYESESFRKGRRAWVRILDAISQCVPSHD